MRRNLFEEQHKINRRPDKYRMRRNYTVSRIPPKYDAPKSLLSNALADGVHFVTYGGEYLMDAAGNRLTVAL